PNAMTSAPATIGTQINKDRVGNMEGISPGVLHNYWEQIPSWERGCANTKGSFLCWRALAKDELFCIAADDTDAGCPLSEHAGAVRVRKAGFAVVFVGVSIMQSVTGAPAQLLGRS